MIAALAFLASAAAASAPTLPVDHVIIGVADLDAGIAVVERRTGAKLVRGGSHHPGRGTRNALMSLGDGTYLELMAPDPAQTTDDPDVRDLKALTAPKAIGWALRMTDPAAVSARLGTAGIAATPPVPGGRDLPDGTRLAWTIVALKDDDPLAPFFIRWGDLDRHPSRTAPGGCRLARLVLYAATGRDETLARMAAARIDLVPGREPRLQADLDCPAGRVDF